MKLPRAKYLYFWKNDKNIGDYTSFYIINHLSIDKIVYKNPFIHIINIIYNFYKFIIRKPSYTLEYIKDYIFPWQNIIFGVGSILDFAPRNVIVWGSGFREYNSSTKATKILAVRGYLSKKLLKNDKNIEIGDPALLLPIIYHKQRTFSNNIAIVPHYKEVTIFKDINKNKYDIIDPRTDDVEAFIDKLTKYQYILSSSLHGVIIAHAYGVKALWIKHGDVGSSDFKYYDYFSSVGIENYPNLEATNIINMTNKDIELLFEKFDKQSLPQLDLTLMQSNLLRCAPFIIKECFQ